MTVAVPCELPPIAIELDTSSMFPSMAWHCWEGLERTPVNPYLQLSCEVSGLS
jgi:hypothetical protein